MKVLFDEQTIKDRVSELGKQISGDLEKSGISELMVLGILKGSFIFMADLVRKMDVPFIDCQFLGVSSYGDATESSGEVKLTHDLSHPVRGNHVLIVEDIADTGLTLSFIQNLLTTRGAASVRTATFLSKPQKLHNDCRLDYVGFEVGNDFVVGYGLDAAGNYRQLPFVAVLPH